MREDGGREGRGVRGDRVGEGMERGWRGVRGDGEGRERWRGWEGEGWEGMGRGGDGKGRVREDRNKFAHVCKRGYHNG